ncbi:MAG TPA: glycosyl hydrolase [Solirubrobacterales bacterium]|nr:glycosyl hydrolase [Solirubrobacterales bacterium]
MKRTVIVVAALAVALLAAPTAGAAVRTDFYGIVQGVLDPQDRQGMADAKVQTTRFMLKWRDIENVRGTYDWSERDRMIGGLASEGIRSLPFAFGSPSWVGNGAPGHPPIATSAEKTAWQNFLKAAVGRYGPGGTYWAPGGKYDQDFGTSAPTVPITTWQIWNEPNLKKFFSPGSTTQQTANNYARLLVISQAAIKAKDPKATIVLAGMPSTPDVAESATAWDFLKALYKAPGGVKPYFDVAALHPYGCNVGATQTGLQKFSAAMKSNGDGATPLWITEFAWGSGQPDNFCKNKLESGQRDLLISSFNLFLQNRKAWNIQRVYWFLWRDPAPGSEYAKLCSICGTAGLLRYNRTAKPAYNAFKSFTAETTKPVASITGGPLQGSFVTDSTPTFTFGSNEAGSTFVCRYDSAPFVACSSPYTKATALTNGAHTFSVKAIDAPGNESAIVSRSFTVDTVAPQTTITSGPSGPTPDTTPTFGFSSNESGATFACRFDTQPFAPCSGPGATHTPSTPLAAGGHNFYVRATDKAKNTDLTPAKRTFTVAP